MSNFVDIFNESKKDNTRKKDKSIKDKIKYKTCKDECDGSKSECKESFRFGPQFDSAYLEHVIGMKEEDEDYYYESTYDGSAIEDDEDPTDPSLDDVVGMEPDLAANYHFGPSFDNVFTKNTLKHSRI